VMERRRGGCEEREEDRKPFNTHFFRGVFFLCVPGPQIFLG